MGFQTISTTEIDRILRLIRRWVVSLSKGDYASALDMLYFLPGESTVADTAQLEEAIGLYSPEYRAAADQDKSRFVPVVSDPSEVGLEGECLVIYSQTDVGVAYLEYDLPIANEWSDLTVSFLLFEVKGGFALVLKDIHVM